MNEYLRERYGDPCRTCGYRWDLEQARCRELLDALPEPFPSLMTGRTGFEERPDLEWNAVAYLAHVADTLRIWAERVAGAALGSAWPVVPYDEKALGDVRGYGALPLAGVLWSLERAAADWQAAAALADA